MRTGDLFSSNEEHSLSALADTVFSRYGYGLRVASKDGHIFFSSAAQPESPDASDYRLSNTVQTKNGEISITLSRVKKEDIPAVFELLTALEKPIKSYFSVDRQSYVDNDPKQGRLIHYSFPNEPTLNTLNTIINKHCNPHVMYYISVLENVTLDEQRHYAKNLRQQNTFTISIKGPKYLTLILRHLYNPLTNRIDPAYPSNENRQKMFNGIMETYHGSPRCATGNSYYPESLTLSYQQALFTLSFMKVVGNKSFSAQFQDLGYGLPVFGSDFSELRNYCLKTVNPVLAYDKANDSDFYRSMQVYLECNCSCRDAADRMFIHTNTMYYRIRKLSQLTGYQMSDIRDTGHLYFVFKCYEALQQSGLLSAGDEL